jgi:hypothetical protein
MNKTHLLAMAGIVLLLALVGFSEKNDPQGIQTYDELKKRMADPPSEYRSAPLWDWNDKITEEGIDFHMKKGE